VHILKHVCIELEKTNKTSDANGADKSTSPVRRKASQDKRHTTAKLRLQKQRKEKSTKFDAVDIFGAEFHAAQ
jgi:hypothetical protein